MCGINGFTGNDASALRRMHACTKHRGPDDQGFFETPEISFAHNRLSIIDLSPGGHQPMSSKDGRYTVIFNGEIYNYQELKADLEQKGETFVSSSDTEVLLTAFARWGEACLPKLNGIFAFAIWDRDERRLTIARDQIGIKPLYYNWDGKRLSFSSEIKGLLELGISRVIDIDAFNEYFRLLYVPAPRTMFRDIKKLPPGHVLTVKQGQMEIRRWWKLTEGSLIRSYDEAVSGVRERFREAVKRQLVSDRPLGVFLSGGIDSTAVVAMMRELDPSGVIKTFTVGYEATDEAEKYNADAKLAAKTAQHFGAEHHEQIMTAQDVLGCLEDVAWHMDEPVANHVQTSTYLLAKFAKPQITVALGGDGGDELFGGYPRYWYMSALERVHGVPGLKPFLRLIGYGELADRVALPSALERHLSFIAQKEQTVSRLLTPSVNRLSVTREALSSVFADTWKDQTNQCMAADIATWLPDESLVRTDKLTMAHGLEERVPLLDVDLVNYTSRIPSSMKIASRTQGKKVLIDAMRPFLPPHVLDQEKRAWMSPMAKWIRGPLLPFVREVLSPSFGGASTSIINFDEANKILEDHLSKRAYGLHPIWALVTLQLWWKKYSPTLE
jgi:asparagine synthase (glutamine-hydrolysing)